MSSVDASKTILAGSANYQATDWAGVSGGGSLDLRAQAEFKRGIDLELGAEALIGLDASVAKFLAVDLHGQANAAARVRAQVQVPLDLFSEAGLAIRLQAVAEAAASIDLAIGLQLGDFLALAETDPRMKGVALRLLSALLHEAKISGGVRAKAAAAAMAYANVACTGTLFAVPGGAKAGFTVAAEAGLGLKAGAGFRVFAQLGLDEPGRLVRRCTDILVDEVLDRVGERLSNATERTLLDELRAPSKIALRTCYELGAELGRNPNFSSSQAPVVAQRCAEVALEEAQRYLLDRLADMGCAAFQTAIQALGYVESVWNAAEPERLALADRLSAAPEDPFEPTADVQAFWLGVVGDSVSLASALGGRNNADEPWVEPLAVTWAATQLAFIAVRRISESGARGTLLNQAADTALPPFEGPSLQPAPSLIAERISKTVHPGSAVSQPTLEDLTAYLLRQAVIDGLLVHAPSIQPVLNLVGNTAAIDAATTIMGHVGGFVAAGSGRVDPAASLDRILAGLQQYVDTRLRTELDPVLRRALAEGDPELQYFVDEVLLASIGFTVGTVFQQVRSWAGGSQLDQATLREACSSVVMNLVGRSLVVTTDVLLNRALAEMSGALRDASTALNQPHGVVETLSDLVPGIDRGAIRDAVEEIFDIAADVFQPLPDQRRARIRDLLYQIIDTRPSGGAASLQQQLQDDAFIPNAEAAVALALELGALIRDNFVAMVTRLLELIGEAILALIAEVIELVEQQVRAWLKTLQNVFDDAVQALLELDAAIEALEAQVNAAAGTMLDAAEDFLGVLGSPNRRSSMRTQAKEVVHDACLSVLEGIPGYSCLPSDGRRLVRGAVDDTIAALIDNELVDDLGQALGALAAAFDDFIEDARNIDPDDDVAGALVELLVDRVEDAIRDQFGGSIRIHFEFRVRGHFDGPRIDTPFGSYRPRVDIDQRFDLGDVRIDIDDVVRVIRAWARGLQSVTGAAHDLGAALRDLVDLERLLEQQEVAAEDTRARRDRVDRQKRETETARAEIRIVHPGAAAAYPGAVPIEVTVRGVARGFLGLEPDEQQRLHLFLNDVPIDLSRVDVEEAVRESIELRLPIGAGGFGSIPLGPSPASGKPAPSTAIGRAMALARPPHPAVARKATTRAVYQTREWAAAGAGSARRSGPEAAREQPGRLSGAGRFGGRPTPAPGSPQGSRGFSGNVTLGRKPRLSLTDRLVETAHPDLILRSTLDPKDLVDGFNTLTVVVTTGDAAARVTESVVFHASPVSAASVPIGTFRPPIGPLKPRVTVKPELLEPSLAQTVSRGGLRRAVRGPVLSADNRPVRIGRVVPRSHSDVKKAAGALKERIRPALEASVAHAGDARTHIARYRAELKPPDGPPQPDDYDAPKQTDEPDQTKGGDAL